MPSALSIPDGIVEAIRGRRVLSGFSGGADSLALLLLLDSFKDGAGFRLEAVHFEHGLRGQEGEDDARWCEGLCAKLRIPFRNISLNVPQSLLHGEGVEAAARRLRLDGWKKLADKDSIIALGHNSGDRGENLLLRLFRGSNSSGLSSMRHVQSLEGLTVVRPILDFSRAQIEAWLKDKGHGAWRTDSSNLESDYKRNFIRNKLLPSISAEMPFAIEGMLQSLRTLEDDAGCLERMAGERETPPDPTIGFWTDLHPAIRCRVLRRWLSQSLGHEFIPDSNLIFRFNSEMEKAVRATESGEATLIPLKDSPGQFISIEKGRTLIRRTGVDGVSPASWSWKVDSILQWGVFSFEAKIVEATPGKPPAFGDQWNCAFDAGLLPETLLVSAWRHGDRMTPFGRTSPVKLKELFTDCGVASLDRPSRPVVRLPGGEPVWIPGVRRSSFATVTEASRRIAVLSAKNPSGLSDSPSECILD